MEKSRYNCGNNRSVKSSDDHLDKEIENMRNMCNRIDSFLYYTPIYILIVLYYLYCVGYFNG